MKKASYKDIQKWVRCNYGEYVSQTDISKTKRMLGLIQTEYKGLNESRDFRSPKTREKNNALQ
jgi:hypothetical protein